MIQRKRITALLVAALFASTVPAATAHTVSTADSGGKAPGSGQVRTVRLVTGDTVRVINKSVSIKPAVGREHILFDSRTEDGRISVIPADARPLISQGRVDPRLFDVTGLIESGYTDGRDLGLIVTNGDLGTARRAAGVRVVNELPLVAGSALRTPTGALPDFWRQVTESRADSGKLWLDGVRAPLLDKSVPQIGAPTVWQTGVTGKGVKVAVLDTGIDKNHPDLANQIITRRNFTEDVNDRDTVGHGTHVASTIAGTGAASGGRYRGVAPEASLLDGKVCMERGCSESAILAGLDWAGRQGAKVINLSLGGPDTPTVDPMEQAVTTVTEKYGALVVAAGGNSGRLKDVSSPASTPAALAVGAVDSSDQLAGFSSRGPGLSGSSIKPEVTAPGVNITAARSGDMTEPSPDPTSRYESMSGTSMATPHVAGAAALLIQRTPEITPSEIKALLTSSAARNEKLNPLEQGFGRIDVAKAITHTVLADNAVDFGLQLWPHHDDADVTKDLTYRNTGSVPITLRLKASATSSDGKPSPAGMFTLAADTVTVPAHGTASVPMTANTRVDCPDSVYSGYITATIGDTNGGKMVVTTPFLIDREVESHNITFDVLGKDGRNTSAIITLFDLDRGGPSIILQVSTQAVVRLRKGAYTVFAQVRNDDSRYFMSTSRTVFDREQTFTADTRQAQPISVRIPDNEFTEQYSSLIANVRRFDDGVILNECEFSNGPRLHIGSIGEPINDPASSIYINVSKINPKEDPTARAKVYHLSWKFDAIPNGIDQEFTSDDLAKIHVDQGVPGGVFSMSSHYSDGSFRIWGETHTQHSDHLVNIGDGLTWSGLLLREHGSAIQYLESDGYAYRAGEDYIEQWNNPIFGPWWQNDQAPIVHVGKFLDIHPQLFGDGSGHYGTDSSKGRTVVQRDGSTIADLPETSGRVTVAPGGGQYRINIDAERPAEMKTSTKINAAWNFRLDPGSPKQPSCAPAWSVRYQPSLSKDNTAPGGSQMIMSVHTGLPAAAGNSKVDRLTVDFSADDGKTWQPAEVHYEDGNWWVEFTNPPAGFVSLRSSLADSAGNTAEQTIIRAYQITRKG